MPYRLTAESGRTVTVESDDVARGEIIAGIDPEGRVVVDWFDARNSEPTHVAGHVMQPFMFGLTLCCQASDKGCEDGVYCRGCYGASDRPDAGAYLYRADDGSFPGLDPIKSLERV